MLNADWQFQNQEAQPQQLLSQISSVAVEQDEF